MLGTGPTVADEVVGAIRFVPPARQFRESREPSKSSIAITMQIIDA